MMQVRRLFWLVTCITFLWIPPICADTILVSDTGLFRTPNDRFERTFGYNPATDGSLLKIQTWGFGGSSGAPGGTNLAGLVIPDGGFDPEVFLYWGTGPLAALVIWNDDGFCPPGTFSPECLDSSLNLLGLPAGSYTIVLTTFANAPIEYFVGGLLGAGFDNGGLPDFNGREVRYAVDVWATVPESNTLLLLGSGLLIAALLRKHLARN